MEETSVRRDQLLLGTLPNDFLRISDSPEGNVACDNPQRQYLQQQQQQQQFPLQQTVEKVPRLSITIVQATLHKNYGITRMDPYVRVRVGTSVLETNTATNGGKTPVWNKVFQVTLQPGYDSIYIELFDERSFTLDEKIAWTHVIIPDDVLTCSKVCNEWYPLSGKQGDKKEGSINIILSYTYASVLRLPYAGVPAAMTCPMPDQSFYVMPRSYAYPQVFYPGAGPSFMPPQVLYSTNTLPQQPLPLQQPLYQQPQQQPPLQQQQQQQPQQQQNVEKDVETLQEMFPTLDRLTIETVLSNNHHDKQSTVNQLLNLTS